MDGLHALLPRAIDLELIYHVVLHRGQNFELHLLQGFLVPGRHIELPQTQRLDLGSMLPKKFFYTGVFELVLLLKRPLPQGVRNIFCLVFLIIRICRRFFYFHQILNAVLHGAAGR